MRVSLDTGTILIDPLGRVFGPFPACANTPGHFTNPDAERHAPRRMAHIIVVHGSLFE